MIFRNLLRLPLGRQTSVQGLLSSADYLLPRKGSMTELLTARQVAELLSVHENYVYQLATSGNLPSYKIGGNRRFAKEEVNLWLESQRWGTASIARTPQEETA